ncbi:MAG TPA: hypothetical protein VLM76_14650 [Patescibacteria group bacterium]|nr:hypothetical protein [Patescibacteria group bacterium]
MGSCPIVRVDEVELASSDVDIRFSFGTKSMPLFRAIATRLAAVRNASPIAVEGVGHLVQYDPDLAAAHLCAHADLGRDRAGRSPG